MRKKPNNPNVLTGNDANIYLDGKYVGFATRWSISINNNATPIQVVGERKPLGQQSLSWSGTLDLTLHVMTSKQEGVTEFDTTDDNQANDQHRIVIMHKQTKKRVGVAIGMVNTDNFTGSNNELSGRDIQVSLSDWQPGEAFN